MDSVIEVVGTFYTDAEKILRNVVKDNGGIWNASGYQYHQIELSLVPEPENEHDPNAIAVYSEYPTPEKARVSRSGKIGYLPRDCGVKIKKKTVVDAIVKEGFKQFYVKIDIAPFLSKRKTLTTPNQQSITYSRDYVASNRIPISSTKISVNKFIFSFLAILFGIFGVHWFYAKQPKRGMKYLLFCWTTVPFFLGIYQGVKALLTRTDSTYLIEV